MLFLARKLLPHILEDLFKSEETLVIESFLHNALLLFKKPVLLLQKTNALFPDQTNKIDSFRVKILHCQNLDFFRASTAKLLKTVNEEQANVFKLSFKEFYTIMLKCISRSC